MTQAEQDAIIANMVRERRELRVRVTCLKEKLEKTGHALNMAKGIAEWAAQGQHNAQTQAFEGVEYPSGADLRELVSELQDAKARITVIDERLESC
jgi:hypothetical protein